MKKFLSNRFALPLFDMVKGSSVNNYLKSYRKLKYSGKDEILEFQLNKLKRLLKHSVENIPFYKNVVSHEEIDGINSVEDLKIFPILERRNIQDSFEHLVQKEMINRMTHYGSSSGSTGKPIRYYIDINAQSSGKAAMYFGWELGKWRMGDKGIHLWGNPKVIKEQWTKRSSVLKDRLFNLYKYPAIELAKNNNIEKVLKHIEKEKFEFIEGYTTAIYLIAKYIEDNNLPGLRNIKYVITTAETLQAYQRFVIEKNIGKVYDNYGCSEIQGVASECRICGKYHVIDPHVMVEYEDIPGEPDYKELLITDLNNYVMPFIRYKLGDVVQPEKTDCQINFRSLKNIGGRTSDLILLPDGGALVVASFFGEFLLKQIGNKIKQYQVVKVSQTDLELHLVLNSDLHNNEIDQIREYVGGYVGEKMNFSIRIREDIPISKNGKFKLLIDNTK